jgi:ABC-type lipoprotein export system ATPase subunit
VIKIENLIKKYKIKDKEITILENLNLTLEKNFIYIITGASGSGKSTFLNILSTIDREYEGKVIIDNKIYKKDKESAEFRKKNIGFIFQSFELLSDFTLRENCLIPLEINKQEVKDIDNKIEQFFDKSKYQEIKDYFPHQLSGGEQQRAAIARALIHDPTIIIADEPTGNLDKDNSEKVINTLLEFLKKGDKILIMVTHDKDISKNIAKKIDSKIDNIKINENINIAKILLNV